MIILGIDPGLAHTGWGVIETRNTTMRCRAYGCITTRNNTCLHERLGSIYIDLLSVINKYDIEHVAIEKIFFSKNISSAIATAHARGAALVACSATDIVLGEYTPMQIKQSVTGTGGASKKQVMYMTKYILKLDHIPKPDHCADALAAAICHANLVHTLRLVRGDKS